VPEATPGLRRDFFPDIDNCLRAGFSAAVAAGVFAVLFLLWIAPGVSSAPAVGNIQLRDVAITALHDPAMHLIALGCVLIFIFTSVKAWLVRVTISPSTIVRRNIFGRWESPLSNVVFAEILYRRGSVFLRVGDGARVMTVGKASFPVQTLREMQALILSYSKAYSGTDLSRGSPSIVSQLLGNFRARSRQ